MRFVLINLSGKLQFHLLCFGHIAIHMLKFYQEYQSVLYYVVVGLTGVLYLPKQIPRQGRGEAVAMFPHVSPQVCGSVAQNYLLLPSL